MESEPKKHLMPFRSAMNNPSTRPQLIPLALATALFATAGGSLQARSFRPGLLPQPDGDRFSCMTCHTRSTGGPRNAFGLDVAQFVTPGGRQEFWAQVFDLDSDGDGFTNGQELGDADGDGQQDAGITSADITRPADAGDFPVLPPFAPGSAEDAGLNRIVADTILFDTGENNLDNWEPFSSVIGNSVFVVEANTFADDGSFANQNFAVALQPVGGGDAVTTSAFYGDDGSPYTGQINGSRQNGNPGRVAGDRRPGATSYIVGGEASPHLFDPFQSDGRWDLGFDRGEDGRYGAVQTFSIDSESLAVSPLSPALDAVNGRQTSGFSDNAGEIGRFGGDVTVLDNGNFVVVVDDRSGVHAAERSATGVILAPDGSVIKESFAVASGQIWSNVTSFQGGFAVRVGQTMYFYNNEGEQTGEVDIVNDLPVAISNPEPPAVTFDTGRGDSTRIASHINSPFVYLAGAMGILDSEGFPAEDENGIEVRVVRVAAFDARQTGSDSFVGTVIVNELASDLGGTEQQTFVPGLGRANLAVDALNRVTVAYEGTLRDEFGDSLGLPQTFVRVLSFDEGSSEFTPLTSSFFAFINQNDIDIRTYRPTVAVTTKEILVAAKGEISSDNNPDQGPDTPTQTTFFTVFSHPDPQDDPTPGVSVETPEPVELAIGFAGGQISITWEGTATLKSASVVTGPYETVEGAGSPYQVTPDQAGAFFILE